MLRVLVGPLCGVCVRNLTWHGYVAPSDLSQAEWPCLLLLLLVHGFPHDAGPPVLSADVSFPAVAVSAPPALVTQMGWPSEATINDALRCGPPFVAPAMASLLHDAVRLARRSDHWDALALLHVFIESGLRHTYVDANSLPLEMAYAHTDRLHVTVETLLSPTVATESGQAPNRLLERLGEGCTAALYDEYVWSVSAEESVAPDRETTECPSRNKLVHGCVALGAVPAAVVLHVLTMAVGLCGLFSESLQPLGGSSTAAVSSATPGEAATDDGTSLISLGHALWQLRGYRSKRHPLARLHHECMTLLLPRTSVEVRELSDLPAARQAVSAARDNLLTSLPTLCKAPTGERQSEERVLEDHLSELIGRLRDCVGSSISPEPPRWWCAHQELGKVAVLRNAVRRSSQVTRAAEAKLLALASKLKADVDARRAKSCASHLRALQANRYTRRHTDRYTNRYTNRYINGVLQASRTLAVPKRLY